MKRISRNPLTYIAVVLCVVVLNTCQQDTAVPTPPPPDITVCASGCDFTMLQAALDAESTTNGMVIEVQDAVHTEASIDVHKSVTIQGQGADSTIVQAYAEPKTCAERVFYIPPDVTATLRALTIRHGNPKESPESGGGVRNEGTLTIEDALLTANSASAGGAIHSEGIVTITNSTLSYNEARGGGDNNYECQTGGALKILTGKVTLRNSTVNHNTALGKGGGVHVACHGKLVLINSTVSSNTTKSDGGGIYLNGEGCFTHATISNNSAKTGGGLYIRGTEEVGLIRGKLSYTNTLIADNVASQAKYGVADCMMGDFSTLGTNRNNLVEDGTCSPTFSGDPKLSELADNGGTTQTHAISKDSLAWDALAKEDCVLETDQRGHKRTAPCDIGAFEE